MQVMLPEGFPFRFKLPLFHIIEDRLPPPCFHLQHPACHRSATARFHYIGRWQRGGWEAAVNVDRWQDCDLPISDYQTLVYTGLTVTIHNSSHGVLNSTRSTKRLKNTFDRTLWCYNFYNYGKSRPQCMIYISTENRPAIVRFWADAERWQLDRSIAGRRQL